MIYNEREVKNRFGVSPSQIADYKGLVGDVSDNIKGVPGIGPKTAAAILQKYETIENFFQKGQQEKNYQKIMEFKDQSIASKYLAEIRRDAPLEINIHDLKYENLPKEKLAKHFESLGFQSMIKRL